MKESFLSMAKPIDWNEARDLIHDYNNHNDRIIVPTAEGDKILSGFSFPKNEVQQILANTDTKRIFIALAYHNAAPPAVSGFTTIILGMDADDNLQITEEDKIFDYCDPCPPRCPNNVALDHL